MIKVNVAEIKKQLTGEKAFRMEVDPDDLELSEADLPVVGKIHLEGTVANVGDVLLVQAEEKARVRRTCARCLKEFEAGSEAKAMDKFYPVGSQSVESDAYVYDGDFVDLTELLRESLLLAEPLRVLCKEDCKGICPVCGADRNVHPCDCDTRTIDPRLSAFKQFIKY